MAHALVDDLDSRYVHDESSLPEDVAKEVRHLLGQARECYIMSEDRTLDGHEMTLGQAEAKWDALVAIMISVVPGKLVYYRPERPSKNYVLLKQR